MPRRVHRDEQIIRLTLSLQYHVRPSVYSNTHKLIYPVTASAGLRLHCRPVLLDLSNRQVHRLARLRPLWRTSTSLVGSVVAFIVLGLQASLFKSLRT